jgi:hypothetical protein
MKQQESQYADKLSLSEVAMVEDALKFYFEKAPTEFNQNKLIWANTYKKIVVLKDQAVEDYRNRDA